MKLDKETAINWWMDDLQGLLKPQQKDILNAYLSQHPQLQEELHQSASTWSELEKINTPTPSHHMEEQFRAMLKGYQAAGVRESNWLETISYWLSANWKTSLVSLSIGLVLGTFLLPDNEDVKELSGEVVQMKKMLMLTMIEQPYARERIKAVNMVTEINGHDDRIINSLVHTLNNDKSVNVRLAALDALLAHGNRESVREALVRSINRQDSPLLQVALADAMVLLGEKNAIEHFNGILNAETMDESVRNKLESTIETLKAI